jgi:riboflavin synthase alpha subunit
MFTGLVRAVGEVASLERSSGSARLAVRAGALAARAGPVAVGDSISVSGACLTVSAAGGDLLHFDVVAETLARTTLGALRPGYRVNLEPALRAGDPLGGHFVLGHVDGTAVVADMRRRAPGAEIEIEAGEELLRNIVPKGSVAVDGVSLTVAGLSERGFTIALVPHTLAETTLAALRPGDRVNIETDILVKAVRRALAGIEGAGRLDERFLREHGFA